MEWTSSFNRIPASLGTLLGTELDRMYQSGRVELTVKPGLDPTGTHCCRLWVYGGVGRSRALIMRGVDEKAGPILVMLIFNNRWKDLWYKIWMSTRTKSRINKQGYLRNLVANESDGMLSFILTSSSARGITSLGLRTSVHDYNNVVVSKQKSQ